MTKFQIVVFIILTLMVLSQIVLAWYLRKKLGDIGYAKKRLLTANEVDFFHRLQKAVGPAAVICPQVAMGALVDSTYSPAHPRYLEHRQSFQSKICDFVLCDPKTMEPLLIVELDDIMHDFSKDRSRDAVTASAGYRTVRFWSRNKPTVDALKDTLRKHCLAYKIKLSI